MMPPIAQPNCKTLVFNQGPENMTPVTHVLAGPWCFFTNQTDSEMLWQAFGIPEEPFANPELLETAAQQACNLVAHLAPDMAQHLNATLKVNLPQSFWDVLLAPWLVTAVEVLVDRLHRLEALMTLHNTESLVVPLYTEKIPLFANSEAFRWHGVLTPAWNHWLFSRLLETRLPATWSAVPHTADASTADAPAGTAASGETSDSANAPPRQALRLTNLKQTVLAYALAGIKRGLFALPFPRIKGFSTGQSLLFSVALLLNRGTHDRTRPLADLAGTQAPPLPLGISYAEVRQLVLEMMPQSLQTFESAQSAHLLLAAATKNNALVRTRVASVAACDDDAYRLRLALCRAQGCRLIFIQHGGEYGYVRTSVAFPLVEYNQHGFISWGWQRHGSMPGNVTPLPHSQLARLRGVHHETAPRLLFVGTEMALLPYTLKSMPRTTQMYAYREDKTRFLEALPATLRTQTHYRPYFDVPSSLSDAPWVLSRFPELSRCTGKLEPHLFGCRVLVLDHPGTTLAQALSAGVPTVLFWNPTHFPVTSEAEVLLQGLQEARVLFHSPGEAAAHVTHIWPQVADWWQSATVRHACHQWAQQYALTVQGNETPCWWKTLRHL